jgi:hypothetical protein
MPPGAPHRSPWPPPGPRSSDGVGSHGRNISDSSLLRYPHSQHVIKRLAGELVNRLRPVAGDVDSYFLHRLNRFWPNLRCARTGALNVKLVDAVLSKQAFRHLAPGELAVQTMRTLFLGIVSLLCSSDQYGPLFAWAAICAGSQGLLSGRVAKFEVVQRFHPVPNQFRRALRRLPPRRSLLSGTG